MVQEKLGSVTSEGVLYTTQCPTAESRSNCVLSLVNQLLLWAAIVLVGGGVLQKLYVHLQALRT